MVAGAGGGMKPDGQLRRHLPHVLEFDQEVALPKGAIVFAVGGELKADVFLEPHNRANGFMLNARKFVRRNLVLFRGFARANQRVGPDEAADMIGPERRFDARQHSPMPFCAVSRPPTSM